MSIALVYLFEFLLFIFHVLCQPDGTRGEAGNDEQRVSTSDSWWLELKRIDPP